MKNLHIHDTFTSVLLFVFLFVAFGAHAVVRENPLSFPGADRAKIGIYIQDLSSGEVLYDVNGLLPLTPASITKSLTAASILTLRDSSYRFSTDVVLVGKVADGNLKGNVVVRCVGDPTVESSHFKNTAGFADSIAAAIQSLGIREIQGTVIIDESSVPYDIEPLGWDDDDIVWPYGANHFGANYKDNKFIFSYPSKKSTPHMPGLTSSHTPANRSLTIDRKRGTSHILTKGTPRAKGESITISMPHPAKAMRHEIMQTILKAGIAIADEKLEKPAKDETVIYTYYSPTLHEILQSLMFRSDNMMAESMLRFIAPGKSRAEAIQTELEMWELRDIDSEQIVLEDGSGLSRNDRLTTYFLADVFDWMASHVKARQYAELFPKSGKEGTLKGFLRETPLEGRLALKTGSMKGIQSYAGYLLDDTGLPTHIVIFMINGFTCGRAAVVAQVENLLLRTFAPGYVRPVKSTKAAPSKKTKRR